MNIVEVDATTEPDQREIIDVEFDITSEMIAAGAAVLDELCPRHGDYAPFVVERVFRAMLDHLSFSQIRRQNASRPACPLRLQSKIASPNQ